MEIFIVWWVIPIIIGYLAAENRNERSIMLVSTIFLGWIGLLIGLLIILGKRK